MEPISAASAIIGTVDAALRTISALVKYGRETRNAVKDRTLLVEEAQALSALLERLKKRAQAASHDEMWLAEHQQVVRQFEVAYEELVLALKLDPITGRRKEESRLKAVRTVATWSFTKFEVYALLERMGKLHQYADSLLADDQYVLIERMDQKQQEVMDQKLKMSLLTWLSPLQMTQVHQTISDRAEKGSGSWFLTSETFLSWQEDGSAPLWCYGIPGAGKTVLASIIVNHLRRERPEDQRSSTGIAVLYNRYNEPEQTLENLLASILKQLAQDSKSIPPPLLELYEPHRERNTPPAREEICDALTQTLKSYDRFFLIVDALDECTEQLRWDLIERIMALQPRPHILTTSRYLDTIDDELEPFNKFELKAHRDDIELYIDHQIRKNRYFRKLVDKSPSLRVDMKDAVVKTADNMFLLARLHVESLASAASLSIKHIRQKLRTLPTTLSETYDDAMGRIESQDLDHREMAFKTLGWLNCACRSLSLRELQHALAVEPGQEELDQDSIMDGQSITALCAGLVIVDRGTSIVNLVHYTATSYFNETRNNYFPNFHAIITLSCAQYLTLKALQNATIWQLVQDYPLACYAAQYMGDHARQSPEESLEPSVLDVICALLSHPDKRRPLLALLDGLALIQTGFYSSGGSADQMKMEALKYNVESEMRTLFDVSADVLQDTLITPSGQPDDATEVAEENRRYSSMSTATRSSLGSSTGFGDEDPEIQWEGKLPATRVPEVTALHLAASMGLAKVASMLLGTTPDIDAVDETGKTALAVAMERGFEKAVEFLLISGACVNMKNKHGRAVLLLVMERNWHSAYKIIVDNVRSSFALEEDDFIKAQLDFLLAACDGDREQLLRLSKAGLLAEPGNEDIGAVSLFLAVECENLDTIKTLLAVGVHPDSKDNAGQSSVHRATRREHEGMIRLLIANGADVDFKDDDGRTPWSANLRTVTHRTLKVLLELGADPSTRGLQGVSELYTAAKAGEEEVVRYMLASGCNPVVKTNYDWTPLHWASSGGHLECTKLLLEAGADPSALSDQNVTPLDLCLQANQLEAIELLRAKGAKLGNEVGKWKGKWVDVCQSVQLGEVTVSLADTKMTLVFDKPLNRAVVEEKAVGQYVYPFNTMAPDGFIYQINHYLETPSSGMSVRRAKNRVTMFEYPLPPEQFDHSDVIYDVQRMSLDYQEFNLVPQGTVDLLPGTLQMHKEWTGGWKIRLAHDTAAVVDPRFYLFRTTPDWSKANDQETRWTTEDGTLLARTGWEDSTPNIRFEGTIGELAADMRHALVSCWLAKLWSENVVRS